MDTVVLNMQVQWPSPLSIVFTQLALTLALVNIPGITLGITLGIAFTAYACALHLAHISAAAHNVLSFHYIATLLPLRWGMARSWVYMCI